MTRDEIEETEWAKELRNYSTPAFYHETVKRMARSEPVSIIDMGDSAEIEYGDYTIHSVPTVEEAVAWCAFFDLPVRTQSLEDFVRELVAKLSKMADDKTLSSVERSAYYNVLAMISRLKGQQ